MAKSTRVQSERRDRSDQPLSRWWILPGVAAYFGIIWLVSRFGPTVMGEAAGTSVVVFALILHIYWRNHRERWFWPFITFDVILHLAVIVLIPWPAKHEANKGDLLFIWVDFFGTYGLVRLFQWAMTKGSLRVFDD